MRLIATVTVLVAVWALWVLRYTWRMPWHRSATGVVALLTVNVLLLTRPVSGWLSPKLHAVTRLWNFEDLIGHACVVVALFAVLHMLASRTDMTDAQLRWFVRYRIKLPAIATVAAMTVLFVIGDAGQDYVFDLTLADSSGWLRVYWLAMSIGCFYAVIYAWRLLLILRRDPRNQRTATVYLVAVAISAACGISFELGVELLQWFMVRVEVIGFAVAASYAWRSKTADLRRFRYLEDY